MCKAAETHDFCQSFQILSYFICANSEGSEETVQSDSWLHCVSFCVTSATILHAGSIIVQLPKQRKTGLRK